jgi:hypothetical protein
MINGEACTLGYAPEVLGPNSWRSIATSCR